MKKDFLLTFLTEVSKIVLGIMAFKLADLRFGAEGFAQYNLARRAFSFFLAFNSLGLGVGLARFVAFHLEDVPAHRRYFLAASFILGTFNIFMFIVILGFKGFFATLFFSRPDEAALMVSVAFCLVAQAAHTVLYAYLRGLIKMQRANLLQLFNSALIPIIAVFAAPTVSGIFIIQGLAVMLFTAVMGSSIVRASLHAGGLRPGKQEAITLLRYGLQRLPADFGLSAILALPPVAVMHFGGSQTEGGAMAFGISVMSMIAASVAPLGLVLLPRATRMVKEGNISAFNKVSLKLGIFSAVLGLLSFLAFYFKGEFIVAVFSKDLSLTALNYVVLAQFAGIFYLQYVALRSLIDAAHFTSYNSLNVLISLGLMIILVILAFIYPSPLFLVKMSFPTGCCALSLLSIITLYKKRSFSSQDSRV
jgi:O-antigen/teichoic acid export membrane protein